MNSNIQSYPTRKAEDFHLPYYHRRLGLDSSKITDRTGSVEQQPTFYLKSVHYHRGLSLAWKNRPASQLMDELCHLYHTCGCVSFMVYFLSTLSGQGEIISGHCYHSKYFPPSPAQFLPACLTCRFHITSYINKNRLRCWTRTSFCFGLFVLQ